MLDQAIMEEANLISADLQGALLSFAILSNAHLVGANLKEAHLGNAILSGANLLAAKLAAAKVNNATTWPEGFNWQREEVDDKGDASSLSF